MPLWFGLFLIVRTTMAGDLRNTHIYDVYISYMMVKQVIILINQRMKYVRWLQKYIGVHIYGDCGDYKCGKVYLEIYMWQGISLNIYVARYILKYMLNNHL